MVRGVAPSWRYADLREHLRARLHRLGRGVLLHGAARMQKPRCPCVFVQEGGDLLPDCIVKFRAALECHSLSLQCLQSLGQARRRDTGPPSSHGGTHLDRVDTDPVFIGVCAVDLCDAVDLLHLQLDRWWLAWFHGKGEQVASSVHHRGIVIV